MTSHQGKLYVLGVGPGDEELITLKALNLIKSCAVIAYPVGADSKRSFARQIVSSHIPNDKEEYGFTVPMREAREPAEQAYNEAAQKIEIYLEAGKDVALLCEGDAFFYGSAMYLSDRLADNFEIEIVPGVTSLTACAAACKRPLAARNERLKILPAPMDALKLEVELANTEAAAIIKVGRHFEKVKAILNKLDLAKNAIIIERATGKNEKVTPLIEMDEGEKPYFSTILIYQGKEGWKAND